MTDIPDAEQIARDIRTNLDMLEEERAAVDAATAVREKAEKDEVAAQQAYSESIEEVRKGGLLTDALLERFNHPVPKRPGRPKKPAGKPAGASAASA
ncbi:hypothetical protein [Rhodococcus baikonurensis]|uniref:Uncharacterized protein n=1 Tax=Rhodococcus baikonurensis TaxID=172041 RepID=A0ABV5XSD8_9NOCA